MACVPILNRRKQYRFEAIVRLHSLVSVPYVNAVTFAKLRLLNSRHSSQYSPRVEIRQHTVTWDTEHRFMCRFRSNPETSLLEPNILKISIRMETKGGKSFCKVGYVSVDLACFTALGNAVSRRRYILEGYSEKHKRLDNSLLLVSFSMRQLFGDTCFRPPPENLNNCLIIPSDPDEADSSVTHGDRELHAEGANPDRPVSSAIDRILADTYSIPRTVPTQAPVLSGLSTQAACDRLQSMWRNQKHAATLTPKQVNRIPDHVIIPIEPPVDHVVQSTSRDLFAPKATDQRLISDHGDCDQQPSTDKPPGNSSSSATPTSSSTSPGSTPTESPVRCPPDGHHLPDCSQHPQIGKPVNSGDTEPFLDILNSIQCHSLPHPVSVKQSLATSTQLKNPQHFATDSGLLLPSRRRKLRPAAVDLSFTQSSFQTTTTAMATPSTGVESRSSGYQSHSRQSSLESQTITGSNMAPIRSVLSSSGYSVENSGSSSVSKSKHTTSSAVTPPPSSAT